MEEDSKANKNTNLKQIIGLIFLSIIVILVGLFTNTYDDVNNVVDNQTAIYTIQDIPEYSSEPYVELNNNIPNFSDDDFTTESFESYSDLDKYGRCGVAFANLSKETMPTEEESRTSLNSIIPTGWSDVSYEEINLSKLYNKCHLIAYSLSAENTNEKNIITGTRYFNMSGMYPFEKKVLNYLNEYTDNHVLYRITPIYEGTNLVASRRNYGSRISRG